LFPWYGIGGSVPPERAVEDVVGEAFDEYERGGLEPFTLRYLRANGGEEANGGMFFFNY
jgi:hypothetical protein